MPNLKLKLVHKFELIAALPLIACAFVLLALGAVYTYSDGQITEAQRARDAMDTAEFIQRTIVQATAKMWMTRSDINDLHTTVVLPARRKIDAKFQHLQQLCADRPDEAKIVDQLQKFSNRSLDFMDKSTTIKTDHGDSMAMKIMGFQVITKESSDEFDNLLHQFRYQLGSKLHNEGLRSIEDTMIAYIVYATICIILISLGSALFLNRNVVNRLARLSANSSKLAKLDQELAKPSEGEDEIAELDRTFYQMATSLAEAIQREKDTIENAADVICTLDPSGEILSVNDACNSVWGFSPPELKGQNVIDVIHDEDRALTNNCLMSTLAGYDNNEVENRITTRAGGLKHLLWSFRMGLKGKEIFAIAHDITERKMAQEKLRASEDRFAAIKEKSPAGIMLLAHDGKIIDANPAAAMIVGSPADALTESSMQEIIPELKLDSQSFERLREHQILQSDGTVKTADIIFDKLGSSDEELLSVLLDTTDRHQLERLKETLVAMIAHDIATPMTTIHSQLHLAEAGAMGPLSTDGLKAVEEAEEQSVGVMNLLTTIMKTAKYKHSNIVNGLVRSSLADLVDAAVESTEFESESKNIDIYLQLDRSLELLAEPDSLAHALKVVLSQMIRTCARDQTITFETMQEETGADKTIKLRVSHRLETSLLTPTNLTWEFARAIVSANGGQLKNISTARIHMQEFEFPMQEFEPPQI
ncbi:MAG TPA: PAS domain S-box protein [Drouetiella sp.]